MIEFDRVTHLRYVIGFEEVCGEDEDGNYDTSTLDDFFKALEPKVTAEFPNATFDIYADNADYVTGPMLAVDVEGEHTDEEFWDLESAIEEVMQGRLIQDALYESTRE